MRIPRSNRDFENDNSPHPGDRAQQPQYNPDWMNYRNNQFRAGNSSTVPDAPQNYSLDDLLDEIRQAQPQAGFAYDALGRQVIQVEQQRRGESYMSHIHLDTQTGAIAVNKPSNPTGGYFVTDQITDMTKLTGQYGNRQELVQAAREAGVYQTKTEYIVDALRSGRNLVGAAADQARSSVGNDSMPWESYDPTELSPQRRMQWANSIALPAYQTTPEGARRKTGASDIVDFLERTGASSYLGNKGSGARLTDLESLQGALYPQNESGQYDANNPKRDSQRGLRSARALYSGPSADQRVPQAMSPFRLAGSPQADRGYIENNLYTMHNVLTPEGQGWIRENAGMLGTNVDRVIPMPEGGISALGFGEGKLTGEQRKLFEQTTGRSIGSYKDFTVDALSVNDKNEVVIKGTGYIPRSGTSSKYLQKVAVASTPDSSGIIPEGFDMVAALPDAKDAGSFGRKMLAAEYSGTENFQRAFTAYAQGYDKLGANDRSWVDENASWIREASGAGGFSARGATAAFGGGVIGGKGADVLAKMSRDFLKSKMEVFEWDDVTIDAATYQMHADKTVGGLPMLEMQQVEGTSGAGAMYRGRYRDYGIASKVLSQYQAEFDHQTATIGAESLDIMARYNTPMYDHLQRLDQAGAFNNPARDIITAVRANYGGEIGENAQARLNAGSRRSVLNLDDAAALRHFNNGEAVDFAGMHSSLVEQMKGASEDQVNEAFLKQVSGITGDHALQVGDMILPSAKAALSTFTLKEDGEAVTNLGSLMAKTLVAQTNAQRTSELGGGEGFIQARDTAAYETLMAAGELMDSRNESQTAQKFLESATGITMPVSASSAIGSKLLAPGQAAISERKLFELTNARTSDEQQQVLAKLESGDLHSLEMMFPEANTAKSAIRSGLKTIESINKAAGRNALSLENDYYMSEEHTRGMSKDHDRDPLRVVLSGQFHGEGSERQWYGSESKAMSAEEIRAISETSVGGEFGKQVEKAAMTKEDYIKGLGKTGWKSLGEVGGMYLDTLKSKSQMGPMYNAGIRGLTRFTDALMNMAGLRSEAVETATSGFSQSFYQKAIDLKADNDPNLKKAIDMSRTLNWESSKDPGKSRSFYMSGKTPVEIDNAANKDALAQDVMKTFASIGLDTSDLDPASEDYQDSVSERLSKYQSQTAGFLAGVMSPINASDETRASAESFLNEYASRRISDPEAEFDAPGFARTVGKKNALHWMVGGENESLESLVPAASYIAGAADTRVREKNPGRANSVMGQMPTVGKLYRRVKAFFKGDTARTVEQYFGALGEQDPYLAQHSRYSQEEMGGGALTGESTREALAHKAPAAPAASEPEVVGAAPALGGGDERNTNPLMPTSAVSATTDQGVNYTMSSPPITNENGSLPFDDVTAAGGSGGSSGSGGNAATAATPPPSGGSGGGKGQFPIGGLKRKSVRAAFSSMEYLKQNQGRIKEIASALATGVDIQPYTPEVDAILSAYGQAEGVYSRARQRKDAGIAFGAGDRLAAKMFDPASDFAADPILNEMSDEYDVLADKFQQHKLATKAARKPSGPRRPDQLNPEELGMAEGSLEKFNGLLKDMNSIFEGVNKGQKEYIDQAKELTKTYDSLSKTAKTITDRGKEATLREGDIKESIETAFGKGVSDDVNMLKYAVGQAEGSGRISGPELSDEEHNLKMMDALLSGGRSGQKKRMKLTDADWERGLEGPGGINIQGETALGVVGGVMRGTAKLQGAMWAATHIQHNLLQPMMQSADFYTNRQGARDMNLLQSGAISFEDMMGGVGGEVRRRDIGSAKFQEEMGRQIYNSYGGLMGVTGHESSGRTAGGIMSIIAPTIGAAIMGNQLGSPVAGAIAGGITAIGTTANYFWQSAQDTKGLASTERLAMDFRGEQPDNIFGKIGAGAKLLASDPLGTISLGLSKVFNPEVAQEAGQNALARQEADQYFAGGGGWVDTFSPSQLSAYTQSTFGISKGAAAHITQESYLSAAGKRGVTEEEALGIYGFAQMYGRDRNMSNSVFRDIEELSVSGAVNLPETVLSLARMKGIAANDREGIFGVAESLTGTLASRPESERAVGSATILAANQRFSETNRWRRIAGMGNMSDMEMESAESLGDAGATSEEAFRSWEAQRKIFNPAGAMYGGAINTAMQDALYQGFQTGNYSYATRLQQQAQAYDPFITQMASVSGLRPGGNQQAMQSSLEGLMATIQRSPQLVGLGDRFQQSALSFVGNLSADYAQVASGEGASSLLGGLAGLEAYGVNPEQLAQIRMGRAGKSPTLANVLAANNQLASDLMSDGVSGEDAELETMTYSLERGVNTSARLSGRRGRDLVSSERRQITDDEAKGIAYQSLSQMADQASGAMSGFYTVNADRYNNLITTGINDPAQGMVLGGQMQQAFGMYQQNLGTLQNRQQTAAALGGMAMQLSAPQFATAMSASSGNRVALTQMANAGQISGSYATMDMTTGMDAFYYGVNNQELGRINNFVQQRGLNQLTDYASGVLQKGGTLGLQVEMSNVAHNATMAQAGLQMQGIALSRAMTTGGATGVDAQGFAVGGDGMAGAQKYFGKYGGLNAGNGMGFWQIEDAMTQIGREKQLFGLAQQGQSLGIQGAQFDLAGKQFYEKWNLNMAQFQENTAFQRTSMVRGRQMQVRQQDWQAQDMAFSRDQSELSFGWQIEDSDRNLKYARGRERLDLMRQRGRAVIQHSMQMGQMDRQESRFDETKKFQDESFKLEKEHFEKGVEFAKEELEMQKRHFEEGRELDKQKLAMQQEAYAKEVDWLKETHKLEDQKRLLERQYWLVQNDMSMKGAQISAGAAAKQKELNDAMLAATETAKLEEAQIRLGVETGTLAIEVASGMNVQMERFVQFGPPVADGIMRLTGLMQAIANWKPPDTPVDTGGGSPATSTDPAPSSPPPSSSPPPAAPPPKSGPAKGRAHGGMVGDMASAVFAAEEPRSFARGGHTGDGLKYEAAGIVHKGEYVVPQGGALVKQGSDPATITVLRDILATLKRIEGFGPMRLNATINTTTPDVQVKDFTPKDRAYARVRQ